MNYRFSGHETFACRYAWLPKAAHLMSTSETQNLLTTSREDEAMVELGVGKNMVRSIKFWAENADIIRSTKEGHEITEFGHDIFLGDGAMDPYLEDIRTLWLIHWKLATNASSLFFVWDFLLNNYQEPELSASKVVRALEKATKDVSTKTVSSGSTEQMWNVFLRSYVPTRNSKGIVREDNLDCPLVELNMLIPTGITESSIHPGKIEKKYAFRREDKRDISPALFAFCVGEFWESRFPDEQSIPFFSLVNSPGSPGQVFKIPEMDIRSRLLGIEESSQGYMSFQESAAIPRLMKNPKASAPQIGHVYTAKDLAYA